MGVISVLCTACSDSSDAASNGGSGGNGAGGASNGACPDISGKWTVSEHCESSLVGMTLDVTEKDCALSFAAPFDVFSGSVSAQGKITLSGPQTCTGTASATSVSMSCTPEPCPVKLSR